MRTIKICCVLCLAMVLAIASYAQNIKITQKMYDVDSIVVQFDKNYFLIEDACAKIVRHARFDVKNRIFFGRFKDVSRSDSSVTVAEGSYTDEGYLNGPFTLRYVNGAIQAQGSFKNGVMDGQWKVFYPDGKPYVNFKGNGSSVLIQDVWSDAGKKLVSGGKGKYTIADESITWEGDLLNGQPTGIWRSKASFNQSGQIISTETFKGNDFFEGKGPLGSCFEKSLIPLISQYLIPLVNAGDLLVSNSPCDPATMNETFVLAKSRNGKDSLNRELFKVINYSISQSAFAGLNNRKVFMLAKVNAKGNITNVETQSGSDITASTYMMSRIYMLRDIEPARINGKPVDSWLRISVQFKGGMVGVSHSFMADAPK
jgi:antitoxin component YwqK of YwqJK toxin-antitoxin module